MTEKQRAIITKILNSAISKPTKEDTDEALKYFVDIMQTKGLADSTLERQVDLFTNTGEMTKVSYSRSFFTKLAKLSPYNSNVVQGYLKFNLPESRMLMILNAVKVGEVIPEDWTDASKSDTYLHRKVEYADVLSKLSDRNINFEFMLQEEYSDKFVEFIAYIVRNSRWYNLIPELLAYPQWRVPVLKAAMGGIFQSENLMHIHPGVSTYTAMWVRANDVRLQGRDELVKRDAITPAKEYVIVKAGLDKDDDWIESLWHHGDLYRDDESFAKHYSVELPHEILEFSTNYYVPLTVCEDIRYQSRKFAYCSTPQIWKTVIDSGDTSGKTVLDSVMGHRRW